MVHEDQKEVFIFNFDLIHSCLTFKVTFRYREEQENHIFCFLKT